MAWNNPRTWSVPLMATAAILNAEIRDNLNVLSGHVHNGAAGQGAAAITPTSITMGAGMIQAAKGADLASANTLTLGSDGNYFVVTGSTQINNVSAKQAGTVIYLRFTSALTVSNNANLILQSGGNWAAPAGSLLVLVCNGSNVWYEVSRWVGGVIIKGAQFVRSAGISGAATAGVAVGNAICDQIGTGAADGAAHYHLMVPSDWAAFTRAVWTFFGSIGGSGRTVRYQVDVQLSQPTQLFNNRIGSIAATNLAGVGSAQRYEIDLIPTLGNVQAGDLIVVKVTNLASQITDGAQQDDMLAVGVELEWRG